MDEAPLTAEDGGQVRGRSGVETRFVLSKFITKTAGSQQTWTSCPYLCNREGASHSLQYQRLSYECQDGYVCRDGFSKMWSELKKKGGQY